MNIKIDNITYITLLIAFLSGYFEYMYILLLIIFIHEFGHAFFSFLLNIKPTIIIYPFGGITILNTDLNISIIKEFICLIGGITFQILFFLLIKYLYGFNLITNHVYNIFYNINKLLIMFNFMPIVFLDGGRILNIIFDLIFNYKLSYKISIYISFIMSLIFLIFNFNILGIMLFIFIIIKLYYEFNNIDNKYNMFLFERYLNNYKFKRYRYINNIYCFKRSYYHFINGIKEEKVLNSYFSEK